MKNTTKLAVSFLVAATSSVAIADTVSSVINTGSSISDSQLQEATKNISAKILNAATTLTTMETTNSSSIISPMAPAKGISYYQIIGVMSPNYTSGGQPIWENIGPTQLSTSINHGGAWINVAVLQYGYGNPNSATLAGYSGNHYYRDLVCGPLSAPYFCGVGETVTGFVDYFQFRGPQAGSYSSSAYSTASPYGTWTDNLYIQ